MILTVARSPAAAVDAAAAGALGVMFAWTTWLPTSPKTDKLEITFRGEEEEAGISTVPAGAKVGKERRNAEGGESRDAPATMVSRWDRGFLKASSLPLLQTPNPILETHLVVPGILAYHRA